VQRRLRCGGAEAEREAHEEGHHLGGEKAGDAEERGVLVAAEDGGGTGARTGVRVGGAAGGGFKELAGQEEEGVDEEANLGGEGEEEKGEEAGTRRVEVRAEGALAVLALQGKVGRGGVHIYSLIVGYGWWRVDGGKEGSRLVKKFSCL
jgi:hypothetical protein